MYLGNIVVDPEIGKRYGSWVVVEPSARSRLGKRNYLCRCSCGTERVKPLDVLRYGASKRCQECRRKASVKSLVGQEFGSWVVLERVPDKHKEHARYKVECFCGTVTDVNAQDLQTGKSTRCMECYNKDRSRLFSRHGKAHTAEWRVWVGLRERCDNPNNSSYKWYGGRGIKVCERWYTFENFFADMGYRPEKTELDRINNDGDYEPGNCRWVTHKENCNNRRKPCKK